MPTYFRVKGMAGKPKLAGEIAVSGAKNAALKAIAASILFDTPLHIANIPAIEDVNRLLDILVGMGARVTREGKTITINTLPLATDILASAPAKRLRSSIVLTGPILGRYGHVRFPHPGGCVIGERPIDLFLESFERMGARITKTGSFYDIRAPKGGLRGTELFFRTQSVTGTETMMMTATRAKGRTTIKNAAMEPEIVWLAEILNASGAKIQGAGTPTVTIDGLGALAQKKGTTFVVPPDRIEAGSFLILGALLGRELAITHCVPDHLDALIETLDYCGVPIERRRNELFVRQRDTRATLRSIILKTHEYPGFPTDLQAPMTVFLTQVFGESMVFETIFEGRLNYVESLNRMGANITMMDPHRVLVKGPTRLKGKRLESPDLRAGLAFIIAALCANGVSEIANVYNIDRGYERIEERLRIIGAEIDRVEE